VNVLARWLWLWFGSMLCAAQAAGQTVGASATRAITDTGSREWNQPRGGPAGTSSSDVAPITGAPVLAWKATFKSIEGDPVSWGGIVYAITTVPEARGRRLVAIDLRTGKPAAKPVAAPDGFVPILTVWQGMVAMLGGTDITFFSQRGDQMVVREKKIAGSWPSAPSVYEGFLFACDLGGYLHCIEMQSVKDLGIVGRGHGQPAVAPGPKPGEVVVAAVSSAGQAIQLEKSIVSGLGSKAFKGSAQAAETGGVFATSDPNLNNAYVGWIRSAKSAADDRWFVYTPEMILAQSKVECHTVMWGTNHLSPIVGQAAIIGDFACGFSREGALISFLPNGSHARIPPEGTALPVGARAGAATLARGVLYLGNWAVELDGGHVLWCDPSIETASPLLPVADGVLVYASTKGELVCMKDPRAGTAAASAPSSATAAASSKTAAVSKPTLPGSGDGVVLADGRRIAGKVTELAANRLHIAPPKGDPIELDPADVALIEDGQSVRLVGAEHAVYSACWNVLRETWWDGLKQCIEEYRDNGFPDESQRLLSVARDTGLDEARASDLSRTLTGASLNRHDNADKQRAKIRGDEDKMRERCAAACVRAADWCHAQSLSTAASVLLAQADRLQPGQKNVLEKAAALIPRGFPEPDTADAARRWLLLAEAILPVAGEVVPPGDADWERVKAAPWDQGAFGVRTANVLLFSRERDAAVVGDCLRHAERTVRVLQGVLGGGASRTDGTAAARRLDVRLHKTRAEYLAELGEHARAMEWSAGYYSPAENIARFYVPRGQRSQNPLERGLEHVVIHELTHQYVSDRWLGSAKEAAHGNPERAGFWVVEGFARFIEDQVAEMDHHGERFDDETVSSLDAACRASDQGKLFPIEQFVDFSQKRFCELGEKPLAVVQLRNTIARGTLSEKSIFYEEGGSLVFYLMNKAGAEKRAALIEYMRAWYESRLDAKSWEHLGYANASELAKPYMSFLAEVGAR
jgi:hypothetical protein